MTEHPGRRRKPTASDDSARVLARCRRLQALRAWLRGYLHEDFETEYGDAAGAVLAFCRDARAAEALRLESEWRLFRRLTEGWRVEAIATVLRDELGGSWRPASARDLTAVDRAFDSSCPE